MSSKKQSSKKTNTHHSVVENPIPETFAPFVRLSEDGLTVFHTIATPRYLEVVCREKIHNKPARVACTLDMARIFGSSRQRPVFDRGLVKMLIDGARSSEQVKKDGDIVTRKFTFEEAHADAVATMERNIEWLYGIREKSQYTTSSDPVVCSCVDALSVWVVKNCQTDTGERYTKSKLPKVLKGVSTLEEFRQIGKQFGATQKRVERIIINATAIHSDDDEEIEVSA